MKAPKIITIMKYLDANGERRFEIFDDLQFPNKADRLNHIEQLKTKMINNGTMQECLWVRSSDMCGVL